MTILTSFKAALEELATGKAGKEKEYVWYGQIVDFKELDKATKVIKQSQSNMRGSNGTSRIRRVIDESGQVNYYLTCKNYTGVGECDEVTQPTTKDMWLAYRGATGESMDKIRYEFPIGGTDLIWEVDVFTDLEFGEKRVWCKVDLEVSADMPELPALPIKLDNIIFSPVKQYSPSEDKIIKGLYANEFVNKL